MSIRGYFSNLDITWTNAAAALGLAVLSFVALHGAVMLFRRRRTTIRMAARCAAHAIASPHSPGPARRRPDTRRAPARAAVP